MRSLLLVFFGLMMGTSVLAQATLPTSWDFATTPSNLPTGWSTNTSSSYSSGLPDQGGGTSRAGKLQATAHEFTIHFFDEPSSVSYNLRAYSSNGANFTGTFVVQESTNGTLWFTLETYTNDDFGNAWEPFTAIPASTTRYIRFYFANKISGINVGLDDVTVSESTPVNEEINLRYQGNNQPSGSSVQFASGVGNPLTVTFGVENLGSAGTLTINGASFTGAAAGDYSVSAIPSSVAPLSSDSMSITFNPTATGSRTATLSIDNSDSDENPYEIILSGIGGTNASEPSANPSTLNIPLRKSYRVRADFDAVTADGYLVLFAKNKPIQATINDNQEYEIGQGVGNAKVAYIGTNTEFWLKEATAEDTFNVRVIAFNGSGNFINYRTSDALEKSIITPRSNYREANYYAGVDELHNSFIDDLHAVINPHMVRFYSNYGPDMIPPLIARDTINNEDVLNCVYSGNDVVFAPPFGWPGTSMNREHTLPSSWMPTSGSSSTPEYQDYHHLFPTISTANSQRSNEPLGEVVNVTSSFGEGKRGTDANGNTVYEPQEAQKGDAARAIFYMLTAYHMVDGNSWALQDLQTQGPDQRADVLLQWHIQDLPSGFELARNDYLDSLQQNRNPFIDSAHWACYINFRTMNYIAEPDSACLEATWPKVIVNDTTDTTGNDTTISTGYQPNKAEWLFYPNPTTGPLWIGHERLEQGRVDVFNPSGQRVGSYTINGTEQIDLSELPNGLYLIRGGDDERMNDVSFQLIKQ